MKCEGLRRRDVIAGLGTAALVSSAAQAQMPRQAGVRLRLALNAYSFDKPLRSGEMTLPDVVRFCADHRVDALDATGYYFPGYPAAPADSYIYDLKRLAFLNGVQISGTGVRNNFTSPDARVRQGEIELVKRWIEVAGKLGATVLRVFSGPPQPGSFQDVCRYMVPAFSECTEYGRQHGVLLGLQHHNDFLQTADQTINVIEAVNKSLPAETQGTSWFGNVLDIGSLRQSDPYREIGELVPYAVSWQIKETVWAENREQPVDLNRIKQIIDQRGYRGVLPFEALGAGDPRAKVAAFLEKIRIVFGL